MGVVGANGAEAGGSLCGVTEIGYEVEGKKVEGWLVAKFGGGKSASGIGDTNAPELLGQEGGNSGGIIGLRAYL